MKKYLWVICLLAFLPGCLSQTHYNELMSMPGAVNTLKENDKNQDQRMERMEKVLHQLQSGLRPEIQNSGVKVEPVASASGNAGKGMGAVRVTMPEAILFASGSTKINSVGRKVLAKVAEGLRAAPESPIHIVGHSDGLPVSKKLRSHFTDNWELSAARAAAVARIFIWGAHLQASRIHVEGRAATEPIADNTTASGRHQNRRIEVLIIKS